jgi:hypothetical protein
LSYYYRNVVCIFKCIKSNFGMRMNIELYL